MYSTDLQMTISSYYNTSNESLRVIAKKFHLSKSSIHRWYKKYILNDNLEKDEKRKIKRNVKILNFLKRSLDHNAYQTIEILKSKILKKFNLNKSISTISKYLKIIGYTKKKITKRFYRKNKNEQLNKRKKFKKLIKEIGIKNILCLDETYINRITYQNYGWAKKEKRLLANIDVSKLSNKYSILMAIDKNNIINYKTYKKESIDGIKLLNFLKSIEINLIGKYLLLDNVSFHKSKIISDYLSSINCKPLYPPAYSPNLNPIEEVFSKLKATIKSEVNPLKLEIKIEILLKKFTKNTRNLEKYYQHSFYG